MKILLVGYYGAQNAGDEWLLEKTKQLLTKRWPNNEYVILHTKNLVQNGCRYVKKFSWNLIKSIYEVDAVVFGGGSVLQDVTSKKSLYFYLLIIWLAKLSGKKVWLIGQGLGPFTAWGSWWLVKQTLFLVNGIAVRDQESSDLLKKMRIKPSKQVLAADLAFWQAGFSKEVPRKGDKLMVSLRNYPIFLDNWLKLAEFFKKNTDEKLFFDVQRGEDQKKMFELSKRMDIYDMQAVLEQSVEMPGVGMMLGMRYHALVWAILRQIPFLALVYDDKVLALAKEFGQEFVDLRKTVQTKELFEKYEKIKNNYQDYVQKMGCKLPTIIARANLNERVLN